MRAKALARSTIIGLILVPTIAVAETAVERLDIEQPRSFGYQIGDKFERSIHLDLRKPYQLEVSSLPPRGRLTFWLGVGSPQVDQKNLAASTRYHIRLTYQIVNIDPAVQEIAVPEHFLHYSNDVETLKALVPASRVTVSILDDHAEDYLQPDRAPFLLRQRYLNSILFSALFLCSLSGLGYLYWGLPFLTHKRPFAEAYIGLKKIRHRAWDDDSYREALQNIHQAFNETAGKTVFAETLNEFFTNYHDYASIQQSITEYFANSRRYFFEHIKDDDGLQYSRSDLVAFVQRCRDIERGLS